MAQKQDQGTPAVAHGLMVTVIRAALSGLVFSPSVPTDTDSFEKQRACFSPQLASTSC